MSYQIKLSDAEVATLDWASNRGYFPRETYHEMYLADGEPEECPITFERTWVIPEPAAWAISDLANDNPHALFSSIGSPLVDKLIELWQSIV